MAGHSLTKVRGAARCALSFTKARGAARCALSFTKARGAVPRCALSFM